MKLTTLIILVALLQCSAKAYSQKINLNESNSPLKKVLQQINRQTGYVFFYDSKDVNHKNITVQVKDASVEEALLQCLKNQSLTYKIVDKTIVLQEVDAVTANKINQSPVDPVTITGQVVDEKNLPIPGATIRLKDGKAVTVTDLNGKFSIEVPNNTAILIFTYIGYAKQEVQVTAGTAMIIKLAPSASDLNEVVVVGYGTQKKVNLTGAIATIGADKLDSRPLVNLADGLQGLIPNLNINLNTGQPGTKASFNVRGLNTLLPGNNSPVSTSPLILVDGVSRDPNLIDPNDVESVTVLKDAASSAIYGGRAANGVILITTKSGKKGAPKLTYSGSYTVARPTRLVENVNSLDYITMFNYAQRSGLASGGYTTTPYTSLDSTKAAAFIADPSHNPSAYPNPDNASDIRYRYVGNTDWSKVLYPGWAPQMQHNLSLSGGNESTTYTAGMGYFRQEGLEKVADQVYQRYTPNVKISSDITKWLTLGASISLTHIANDAPATTRISQGGPSNGSWLLSNLPPLMPVYNPDGNFAGQGYYTNPVAVMKLSGRDIDSQNDLWSTARIVLRPAKHLTINADYTWNNFSEFDKANLKPYNEYGVNGQFVDIYPWTNPSSVTENRQNNNYTALNAYATYENTFATKNYFKALIGYNQEYNHYNLSNSFATNLIDPNLPAIGTNTASKPTVGGTETEAALVGTFFRLNYIYDNKYLLEVNGRYDGTSRFRPDDRYAFSPSVSAGWNIAQEGFMKDIKNTVNQLKLRASYGKLPDQLTPPGAPSSLNQYPYLATQLGGTVNYLINGQPGIVVNPPGLISSKFTWEKVETTNFGLDYAFLNERLSGSFDYFITNTNDILVNSTQLPAVLGVSAPPTNSADLHKTGWELSLTWKDRLMDNKFNYGATLSLANNSNTKVTKYNANPTNSLNDFYVGEKIGDTWGFVNQGFYKTDAEAQAVDNSALAGYKWLAGDIKYKDLNGDGKINYGNNTVQNPGDQKIIANQTPHYTFGLNLTASYSNFDFTGFLQGVMQHKFLPNDYIFYAFRDDEYSIPGALTTDYWTPTHTDAYFPRVRFAGGGNEQSQDKYVLNAAYARVKQLTLGYTLPKTLTNKIKVNRVRFYVTGNNLFTITSLNKAYDPEITNFNTYPINKSVSFGLQATL